MISVDASVRGSVTIGSIIFAVWRQICLLGLLCATPMTSKRMIPVFGRCTATTWGGQTLLLSHRPVETGVPVVQALCSASDLAGRGGGHGDTHKMYFPKMKDRLLPVFNRAVSALLTNLKMRGMLDETLIVFLTDFGRTLKINKNGGHRP